MIANERDNPITTEMAERWLKAGESYIAGHAAGFTEIASGMKVDPGMAAAFRQGISAGFHAAMIAVAKGEFDITEMIEVYSAVSDCGPRT